jgi:hypothetical protein
MSASVHAKDAARRASTEVEQLPKKAAASSPASAVISMVVVTVIVVLRVTLRQPRSWHGTLDDLVELAAIKPDAATLWTIVHLNTLPFRHDQRYFLAYRTLHQFASR